MTSRTWDAKTEMNDAIDSLYSAALHLLADGQTSLAKEVEDLAKRVDDARDRIK